ncbi:MAG: polya polymerase [Oscillospiraceae bacterium]|nr:polya polymerase [Oscillospiraceae bacterium]
MKIKSLKDVTAFKAAIDQCTGDVWLESVYGDKYNLKSELSQYIAMAELLQDKNEVLELFARKSEDEAILMRFLSTLD